MPSPRPNLVYLLKAFEGMRRS